MSKKSPAFTRNLSLATIVVGVMAADAAQAQDAPFEVYGFVQLDAIQDFNRIDPAWESAFRPSKIPTVDGKYGDDGQTIFSVKQSRLGVRGAEELAGKPFSYRLEIDLYGTGEDAGQTTLRLRHAYGQWGPILAGQTNSVFMDIDTFPNTIDYWGPNGMVFLRTPQIRYTYTSGKSEFAVALEHANNDIDVGNLRTGLDELGVNIQGDESMPDLTAHYRYQGDWGHVQLAGILRRVGYETIGTMNNEPSNSDTGWGVNASGSFKLFEKDKLHLSAVVGDGIASYMNDGGVDLAPAVKPGVSPPIVGAPPAGSLEGQAATITGLMAYYDHYWNDRWSSSLGWSSVDLDNTSYQSPDAFKSAQYVSGNLLFTPDPRLLVGAELLWGEREDFDGASGDDTRIQFSFKYSFSSLRP